MQSFIMILQYVGYIILGIFGLGFLIGFHELGHFLFCKLFRIKTPSFSIGMGPKLLKKKFGDTEFSLSAIPLGGYVEIAGLEEVGQGEQKEAKRSDHFSFAQKPYYQKLAVLCGGIFFNLLFAYVAFIILFMAGIPKIALLFPEEQQQLFINHINDNSIAQKVGLKEHDKIQSIMYYNFESFVNKPITSLSEFTEMLHELAGKQVTLFVRRGVEDEKITIALPEDGPIGIEFKPTELKHLPRQSFFESIKSGIAATNALIVKTVASFKNIFNKKGVKSIGGPLLIIREVINSAQRGAKVFFILLSLISINLAVLNLIPLPIMDGGQIVFTTIESIMGRELNEKVKYAIHMVCWIFVIGLMIILTLWDAKRIFMS